MLNSSRDTHGVNQISFTQCQFRNWGMITTYNCMVVHREVYSNDIIWRKKEGRERGKKKELFEHKTPFL